MTDEKQTIQEMSIDTRTLIEALEKIKVGEKISYKALSETINRDVQESAKGNLRTARRSVRRDKKIHFGTIISFGLVRSDTHGVIAASAQRAKRINSQARESIKDLYCADMETATDDQKVKVCAAQSFAGALYLASKVSAIKKIEKAMDNRPRELPTAETLKLFQ